MSFTTANAEAVLRIFRRLHETADLEVGERLQRVPVHPQPGIYECEYAYSVHGVTCTLMLEIGEEDVETGFRVATDDEAEDPFDITCRYTVSGGWSVDCHRPEATERFGFVLCELGENPVRLEVVMHAIRICTRVMRSQSAAA